MKNELNPFSNPIIITCQAADTLPLDKLLDFQGGLKSLSAKNRDKLVNSILKEGFMDPILIWNDMGDYKIINGHQRLTALNYLKKKGWDIPELPVAYIDADNEKDARRKLLKITSQFGEFELEELQAWLDDLDEDIDETLRLVDAEMDLILTGSENEETMDDDEIPEVTEPITKLGDLWEIGKHRLLCGDSTCVETVSILMNGQKFDSLITSPPYNQGNGAGDLLTNGKKNVRLYADANADNKTEKEYYDFIISVLNNSSKYKKELHSIVWNVSYNAKSRDDYGNILFSHDNPYRIKESIVWDKGHSINLPQVGIYSRRCEFIFIMSSTDKYLTSQTYNDCRWNVYNISSNKSQKTEIEYEHRAAYPLELSDKMINDFTNINNIIYEPFTGTGTTMISAEKNNRICYGMELDEHYCDITVNRYHDWCIKNGKDAIIKLNGAKYDGL